MKKTPMNSKMGISAGCTCHDLTLAKCQALTYVCFTALTKCYCGLPSPENSIAQALFPHWD